MIGSPVARVIFGSCLLLVGCGGAGGSVRDMKGASVSSDAPSWARAGDEKTDEGSLFVCEGEGASEEQATEAARAICSAKICELCGVEVKATVETRETLAKVDVERKVVETCRRVRKSEDQVRYRQAGCGPRGCMAWLQVFFGAEAEARECRAYADGNFADSTQCESLIDQFRATPDVSSLSFHTRVDLLNRAIVACAEIDVRPTPKLTALDEILWQGVVSPHPEARPRRSIDKTKSIGERLRTLAANQTDAWKVDFGERVYRAIDRQPLLESKVFVDRVALIRDAMSGYESVMTMFEALVDAEHAPDSAHDLALVRALQGLKPVAGRLSPAQTVDWAAGELSRNRETLMLPGLKAYLMETFVASHSDNVGDTLIRAMASDLRASQDEWKYVMQQMSGCVRCATSLLDLPDHGVEPRRAAGEPAGDATRVTRLVELSRLANRDAYITPLQGLSPEFLLRSERALDVQFAAKLFTYEWLEQWLRKLPIAGRDAPYLLRDSWASSGLDWQWTVAPSQHKDLAARLWQLLQARAPALRCVDFDKQLSLLEEHGVDTRGLESTLCRCVSESRTSGMRELTDVYLRLVTWGAGCVSKEGA